MSAAWQVEESSSSLSVHNYALAVGLDAQRAGRLALRPWRPHAQEHLDAFCLDGGVWLR